MSIASRITSIEGHIEDDYKSLQRLGADLTNVDKNIENIASVVDDIYDKLPKVTGTGSDLSLTPTLKGGLNILPLGNTEQDGTPTPSSPIDVKIVTGDNQVVVSNSDNTQSQNYTLHLGSLELCKIGDYQDVITGTKDNWKVVRNIGKVVLDGSESNWEGSTNRYALNIDMVDGYYYSLCNYFRDAGSWSSHTLTNNTIAVFKNAGWNKGRISINTDVVPSGLANFKTWLSTHNTTVYYQLATPTEETITDTSLVQSLNELNDLMSYDGTTNIVITSNSANAQLTAQISALKGE